MSTSTKRPSENRVSNSGPKAIRHDCSIALYVKTILASAAMAAAGSAHSADDRPASPLPAEHSQGDRILLAQATGQGTSNRGTSSLEEVIVRARRYLPEDQTSATGLRMNLIDTPQSISVLTPDILAVAGATSIYEATDLVPGLERGGAGFGLNRFLMRGNLVSAHRINGTRFNSYKSLNTVSIERIEVVRGPATVLYGVTGSFGGEINHVLKSAQADTRAEFGLRAGDYDLMEYQGDITGAIPGTGDRLQARVVGSYRSWSTPIEVVDVSNDETVAMATLKFDISDNTSANVWYYVSKLDQDPYDGGFLQQRPDGSLVLPKIPVENRYYSDPRYSSDETDYSFLIADLKHRFANDWQFDIQGTYATLEHEVSEYYPFGPAGAYGLGDDEVYLYNYDLYSDSSNMTFNVSLGGGFELMNREHQFFAAVEYEETADPSDHILYRTMGLGVINMYEGGRGVLVDGSPVPLVDKSTLLPRTRNRGENNQLRASLQVLLNPLPRLEVLAGALYHESESEGALLIAGGTVLPTPVRTADKFDHVVKRFGVTYDIADNWGIVSDARAYVSYSEGFNPNVGVRGQDGLPLTDPQEMEQYEVGLKVELAGGRINSSLAYYDSSLTNLPVGSTFLGQGGGGFQVLQGTRDVKGVEFELVGELLPGWNLAFNYAYTDSEVRDPNFDFTIPVVTVPKNQAALLSSYEFQSGSLAGLRIGGTIVAKEDYTFFHSLPLVQRFGGNFEDGGHTRVDLNASYRGFLGTFEGLELYANVHNLFDEEVYVSLVNHPGFGITHENARAITFGLRYVTR